ncbi:MAG: recombinase RecA [Eubacterium sp.]|jgi:recombination protein RecA|nr:recombinase RecA [Eubacterium sp.]
MAKKDKKIEVIRTDSKEEKQKALKAAMAIIEQQFGAGAVMYMGGENRKWLNIETISSGSLTLDLALGIGGLPRGRIIEIFGPESGGKTTVTLHAIAAAQKEGGTAAFIDVEHALDPVYAKALGVNIDDLIVSQPDTGEQALEIIETLVRSGAIDIIVLDSVAAMVTKAEIDGDMGDAHVGVQARLMSAAMRKLTSVISKSNCVAIFINQVREKIGGFSPFGPAETTPGGRALKFYSSVRIEVRRTNDRIIENGEQVGVRTRCKIVKNKVAPPFKTAEFDMIYGKGIQKVGEILDVSCELGVTRKSGAWFYYGEERLGQGRENAKSFLEQNSEIRGEIEQKTREKAKETGFAGIEETPGSGEAETAPNNAEKTVQEKTKQGTKIKKSVIVETEENFEEFSPDEL